MSVNVCFHRTCHLCVPRAVVRERLLPQEFRLCGYALGWVRLLRPLLVNVYFHWNFIYVIMPSMGSSASQAIVRECVLPQELHLCGHALDGLRCFSGHYS